MYPQAGVPEGGNCGGVVVATVVAPVRTCNLLPRTCVHEAFGLCFAPPGVSQGQALSPNPGTQEWLLPLHPSGQWQAWGQGSQVTCSQGASPVQIPGLGLQLTVPS